MGPNAIPSNSWAAYSQAMWLDFERQTTPRRGNSSLLVYLAQGWRAAHHLAP